MTRIYDLKKARREIANAKRAVRRGQKPKLWALIPALILLGVAAFGASLLPEKAIGQVLPDGERVRLLGVDAPEKPPRA